MLNELSLAGCEKLEKWKVGLGLSVEVKLYKLKIWTIHHIDLISNCRSNTILLFANVGECSAQSGCPTNDPNFVPIDGGLNFFIASGVVYRIKKVRDGRKEDQQKEVK